MSLFQSTLLMRGATLLKLVIPCFQLISIHAPHARSDHAPACHFSASIKISIHAPHARSDRIRCSCRAGRARNFNPRSSCEERQYLRLTRPRTYRFQSTLLMRGATPFIRQMYSRERISIHAPHARSDCRAGLRTAYRHISIHAPHARSDHLAYKAGGKEKQFQSTLLMRGATHLFYIHIVF